MKMPLRVPESETVVLGLEERRRLDDIVDLLDGWMQTAVVVRQIPSQEGSF